jgi:hypothetical protein
MSRGARAIPSELAGRYPSKSTIRLTLSTPSLAAKDFVASMEIGGAVLPPAAGFGGGAT